MELIGRKLGKYEIIELLGSGGMAEVYKGLDTRLERPVAIKVMHRHLAKSADFKSRFLREAKATANLQHPNIVNLIDFDNEDDLSYMVMEFVQGGTLEDYLLQNSPLDLNRAIDIAQQIAAGLEYAHDKNMVHRDIKPANILFADEAKERIVITDFGVTKLLDEESMTVSGAMLGTPHYMAPEVVKGKPADQRADIYSLGIVFFQMVTGELPYKADTPYAVLLKHTNEPIPSPSSLTPGLPLEIEETVFSALQKEPKDRFQSAAEFNEAIKKIKGLKIGPSFEDTIDYPSPFANPPLREKAPQVRKAQVEDKKPASRNWLVIIGGALVAVVLAALAIFQFWPSNGGNSGNDSEQSTTGIPTQAVAVVDVASSETPVSTITPSPTSQPPTEAPTQEPTSIPTVELIAFDFEAQPAFVCDIDFDSVNRQVRIKFDDMAHPPAGTEYVVWLTNSIEADLVKLGPLSINQQFSGEIDVVSEGIPLTRLNRLVISQEIIGSNVDSPTNLYLDGAIESERFEIQRRLLADILRPGLGQYQLALQHANFAAEALAQDSLIDARRHAEHVINILEGERGNNFGDRDDDGQIQNPGNGVGVLGYLAQARTLLSNAEPLDPEYPIFFVQNGIDVSLQNSRMETREAVDVAIKLFSVDTAEEGESHIDNLIFRITAGIEGGDLQGNGVIDPFDGEGGLQTAQELVVEWIEESYFPDHLLEIGGANLGRVRLISANGLPFSQLEIDIFPVPFVDNPETGYFVFLLSSESGEGVNLGQVDPQNFQIAQTFSAADILFGEYDQVVISIEPLSRDTVSLPNGPTDIRFKAELGVEEQARLMRSMHSHDGGVSRLESVSAESSLALQHLNFMFESLNNGDLPTARRHAEHAHNILVGEEDGRFGDVDGNGSVENPSGNGVGAITFLTLLNQELDYFNLDGAGDGRSQLLNGRSTYYGSTIVPTTLSNQNMRMEKVLELVEQVLNSENLESARPFAEQSVIELNALLNGKDYDGNGVIDLKAAEGGLLGLHNLLHQLTDRSFSR